MKALFDRDWIVRGLTIALAALAIAAAAPAPRAHAWTYHVLHSFCAKDTCDDGQFPLDVIIGKSGKLTGVAFEGGTRVFGTAFSLHPPRTGTKWKYKTIFDFCNCSDGGSPDQGLVLDKNDNLYGISEYGSVQTYKLTPRGALQSLHNFGGSIAASLTYRGVSIGVPYDGRSPLYGLSVDDANAGIIFALQPKNGGQTWDFSTIYTFCSAPPCSDASEPAWVVADPAGNFFGVTSRGGETDQGVVFELTPSGNGFKQTVLHSLCNNPPSCSEGTGPTGFAMDQQGTLFGTMYEGGLNSSSGDIYRVTTQGKHPTFTILHGFCAEGGCADGRNPQSKVAVDANGNVFGTTTQGGLHGAGTIFEVEGKKFKKLYDFCAQENCADGGAPLNMTIDSAGNLFGVTQEGGSAIGVGTVFELTP